MADYMDKNGIRISPAAIEFYGIDSGKIYRELVTVRNVSKVSKNIRFYGAKSEKFVLKVKNPTRPVAPGLQVQALVEYETDHVTTVEDRLIVSVDGDPVEIPIRVDAAKPMLSFDPKVDFGSVVAITKVITRDVVISNRGDKAGDFNITYEGKWPINILPMSGTVPPKTAQVVKVEYVTKTPGKFNEVAMIELEGRPEPLPLSLKGVVVERKLELLSLADESPVNCIRFGNNYYGTDRTETGILYNNSPEPVSFVAVVKDDAVGQELGTLDASATDPTNCLTQVISAIPNQGTLPPYAKVPIFFRFSPRWSGIKQGWKNDRRSNVAPRQDFALFMHLELVGATSQSQGSFLEIALTGTALPVEVTLSPLNLEFGSCVINDHVDNVCTLTNKSQSLALEYNMRRIAHYTVSPQCGKLAPGATQRLFFSFNPKQIGTFSQYQEIDVLGPVADEYSYNMAKSTVIQTLKVKLHGQSLLKTIKKGPVYNAGITPKISNEVGLNAETTFAEAKLMKAPRAAVLESLNNYHYNNKTNGQNVTKDLVSFPNDRACSIRPSKKDTTYRTLFTKEERYNYVDPDYAFTDPEEAARVQHASQYNGYLEKNHDARAQKIKASKWSDNNNDLDIGIVPNAGIRPPVLRLNEIKDEIPVRLIEPEYRILSSKEFAEMKEANAQKPVGEGLNAVPTKREEMLDCQRLLTPQELHQVVIGPPTIEFGDVCLRSVCTKDLNIVNNLSQYVHIVVNADCRELRQSSPLSQVIPPCSRAVVPIIFESNTKGLFQRSLTYSVNAHHKHHVTVSAHVVPVSLEIQPDEIQVAPSQGQPAEAGYRGVVTLRNPLNHVADFTWEPIIGERGTAFSIRPASGTVEAEKSLDCEVVFHPSYLAPEEGLFSLHVQGGKSSKLSCTAKFGTTHVDFAESRIMFGSTPLHMTETKTALLMNKSHHHAYFEVVDTNPFPGMNITPKHGQVPVGGNTELQISLTSSAVIKFDTRVMVSIRGWKTIELRIGGTVSPPCLDIDVDTFNLGGVHSGSQRVMPFLLKNMTPSKAKVELDLSRYPDFTYNIPSMEMKDVTVSPGLWILTLSGDEVLPCELHFKPTEVASYDFYLPVIINDTGAPSPAPSSYPATPAPSEKNTVQPIIRKHQAAYQISTPRRRVIATALRQPLQLSHQSLEFSLPVGYDRLNVMDVVDAQQLILVNNSDKRLSWAVDTARLDRVMREGVFQFLHASGVPFLTFGDGGIEGTLDPGITCTLGVVFSPAKPGVYRTRIPIVIEDNYEHPYTYLELRGELKQPEVWFDPLAIVLTPAPLKTTVSAELTILASNYQQPTQLTVEYPDVAAHDGTVISPLCVTWPNGSTIQPCVRDEAEAEPCMLVCQIYFSSPRPVSFTQPLVFSDPSGRKYKIMVTASADNCLMTSYPFIAQHRSDHHVVREQRTTLKNEAAGDGETVVVAEAVYKPTQSPLRAPSRPSTSATSSEFQHSSSSYEGSKSITDSTLPSTPREGALIKLMSQSDHNSQARDMASRTLGSVLFPDEDSDEGIFHSEVVLAVQRWFSSCGWPGGQTPIRIPASLRSSGDGDSSDEPIEKKSKSRREVNNRKKEKKGVFDMIAHLLGRPVPGIPVNTASGDVAEQLKQIYWQHDAMLVFLRSQGGCLASIRPEFLMDYGEYRYWHKLQTGARDGRTVVSAEVMDKKLFDSVSKRAWTDTLLQVLKTLVLSKITPASFKSVCTSDPGVEIPVINKDPLGSNVYNTGERVLLAWLNHCYSFRDRLWSNGDAGGSAPASRWIVNFDYDLLDGLVLASVIGVYCPFVVETHLKLMYTKPTTPEQCLHNALKVVNMIEFIGLQYDIQAIDITDPNPIALMLFCMNLYQHMHQYLPKSRVDFQGALHSTVTRQVRLSNPSGKPLHYTAMIVGKDGRDFSMPKGGEVTVAPRGNSSVNVEFTSRELDASVTHSSYGRFLNFRRPAEAMLLLVGKRMGSAMGSTVVFELRSSMSDVKPRRTIKCESPCYELLQTRIDVTNPFEVAGKFRAILMNTESAISRGGRIDERRKSRVDSSVMVTQSNQADARMEAFFMSEQVLDLPVNGKDFITLDFLPFDIGKRQCYILFVSEEAGEFMYQVDASGLLPRPTPVSFMPSPSGARIIGPPTQDQEDQNIIYWKCPVKAKLREEIQLPLMNTPREEALLMASQKLMSEDEFRRRDATGTLASEMLMNRTLGLLSGQAEVKPSKRRQVKQYEVSSDSSFFTTPENVKIVQPIRSSEDRKCTYPLTVDFYTESTGHYPCRLIVRGVDDVRVYRLECFASADGDQATIQFKCPVQQSSTQNIPIINTTGRDWQIRAHIDGEGFYGPNMVLVNSSQTCPYPLMFKPMIDREIKGKLKLVNLTERTEQLFNIVGKATPALALETVKLECVVGERLVHTLKVPNLTQRKLRYEVQSDVDIIHGDSHVTVWPGQIAEYDVIVTPLRRGDVRGVITFTSGRSNTVEVDSDGEEVEDPQGAEERHQVWLNMELDVVSSPPLATLDVTCSCQNTSVLEIPMSNPTSEDIEMEVELEGRYLSGAESLCIKAHGKASYELYYQPALKGKYTGAVVFYHEMIGEVWYALNLTADPPQPTILEDMVCQLGQKLSQDIVLKNTTDSTLKMIPRLTDNVNYTLDLDVDTVIVRPNENYKVPLIYCPSTIGPEEQNADITFTSDKIGEWLFSVRGLGQAPQLQEPVGVYTQVGCNTNLLIPFRNPLNCAVYLDIRLTDKNQNHDDFFSNELHTPEQPFCLVLKQTRRLRLKPRTGLDVAISFAPGEMRQYEAMCVVDMTPCEGRTWQYDAQYDPGNACQQSAIANGRVSSFRWTYPIMGVAEVNSDSSSSAVVSCQARNRVEETVQLTLAGVPASLVSSRNIASQTDRPRSGRSSTSPTGDLTYELDYDEDSVEHDKVRNAVALQLTSQAYDASRQSLRLTFRVIFAPSTVLRQTIPLVIRAATGGVWRFLLTFNAEDPEPDDVIELESVGLNKTCSVGFRLTGPDSRPVAYEAYFDSASDPEFVVSPRRGELLPAASGGTLFTVYFTPNMYGKVYRGRLIIKTAEMQWIYIVRGVPPNYAPPAGHSTSFTHFPNPLQRVGGYNFPRKNLKLTTTAISSPIKGAPILLSNQKLP